MKIAQIEAFHAVIRAGSISQAARQLYVTQPALSLQIRDLEEYFHVKLLERSNKGVKPTRAGDLVYYYGEKMLNTKQTMWQKIEKLQNGTDQQLAVGASSVAGGYIIPPCIYRFQEDNPAARIQLTVASSNKIIEMLIDGHLDVAVAEGYLAEHNHQGTPEIKCEILGFDELVLVGSPAAVREKNGAISVDELYHIPLIMREKGSGVRSCTEEALLASGLDIGVMRLIMEVSCIESIKMMLRMSNNFAFMALQSVQKEIEEGQLQTVSIDQFTGNLPITLMYADAAFLSPLHKKFIECVRGAESVLTKKISVFK